MDGGLASSALTGLPVFVVWQYMQILNVVSK